MKTKIDYILLDEVKGFEFGLVANKDYESFEIVVIHHKSTMVRTIDYATTLEEGIVKVTHSIQVGFTIQGLSFKGKEDYLLPVKPIINLPVCI